MNRVFKTRLKVILQKSKVNHKIAILKQVNLKYAHVYCKTNSLPGQVSGPLIENYIKNKYFMEKNKAKDCIGDLKTSDNTNIEIKISNGGKSNDKFNYVQLRLNHNCNYILTAYHIHEKNLNVCGELYIFKLDKEQLKKILLKHGSYAHGTIKKLGEINEETLNSPNNDKEYALRPKFGDKCWQMLMEHRQSTVDV